MVDVVNRPQSELLVRIVDAARATEDRPEPFMVSVTHGAEQGLSHPGLGGEIRVYLSNLRALQRAGFVVIEELRGGSLRIEITRAGFVYVDDVLRA